MSHRAPYAAAAAVIALIGLFPRTAHSQWPTTNWATATPRAAGLDAQALARFDSDVGSGKYGFVDSMLVIRHGRMVFDRSYPREYSKIYGAQARQTSALNPHDPSGPYNYFNSWWHPYYRRGDLHTLQSVTKTITSLVIGAATRRNEFPSLDSPVLKFFDETKVANVDDRKRRMTIRHLLTMTSGLAWNERLPYDDPRNSSSLMEASADWVQYTIDQPMAHEPGSQFNYSSGAAQLLSYIFRVAIGQDIEEYAAKHLFAPLGIERFFWKRSPWGLADTEGGLYLERHDLARIMYLFHKKGAWNGKQIVNPDWINASLTPGPQVSGMIGATAYGFLCWLYQYGTDDHRLAFAGMGFGGQMAIVIPDYDLICVFTGWNILGDKRLNPREAIDRLFAAVIDRHSKHW